MYNAKKHPDVIQGKKTEQQVLMDFIETFEIHHGIRNSDPRDNRITLDEFLEYYDNVSISIEKDEYFALMINNSWNIKGDAYTYQKLAKGWTNRDDETSSQVSQK